MLRGIPADQTRKSEIVSMIHDGGQSVGFVSPEYGVSSKAISRSNWTSL